MVSTIVLALLLGTAYSWPTRTQLHEQFHHTTIESGTYPTTHPGSLPPIYNGTIPGHNGTHNGTHGNSTGVSWLPSTEKVRGVNLGSQFIIEPWMAYDEFNSMGCGELNDEWQCVKKLGQDEADAVFEKHWDTWITQQDIVDIASQGLNVVRIPVGFWMKEDLVLEGEYYPRGALKYLDRLVGWAADEGLYVIMDLHGGPGAQYPNQQFTGHGVDTPGFYTPENYERAVVFLEWMTHRIHSNTNYRTTGVLGVMNEPVHASDYPDEAADMLENFYPAAYTRIRAMERSLGVRPRHHLKIQYMGLLFDDHRYYKWDTDVEQTKEGYVSAACGDDRGGNSVIIGDWSLAIGDEYQSEPEFAISGNETDIAAQKEWYQSFWAAQVQNFEQSAGGHIFWTYKCNYVGGIEEWRWCYQYAVAEGVIPDDVSSAVSLSPCS